MKNMKYLIAAVLLIVGCASNPPKADMDVFKQYKCEQNKKLAEDSGSGIVLECGN